MSRNGQLVKNTGFFFIGNLGSKAIGFLMIPLYTIWLTPSEYGVTDLLNSYNQILILLMGLGVAESLIVFPINRPKEEVIIQFSTSLIFLICFHFIFGIIYFILSLFQFKGVYFEYIWFGLGFLITQSSVRLLQNFCCGISKMSVFSYTGILNALSLAILSFLLIPSFGVKGFLCAGITSAIITLIFIVCYSRAYSFFSIKGFSPACLKEQLKFSIPLIPNSLMWWLILGLNRPLLEAYAGVAVIGLFAIADKIPSMLDMLYNLFQQSWLVTVTQELGKNDFSLYFSKVMDFILSLQCFVCMLLMALSEWIIQTFCDARYEEAHIFVPILCLGIIFSNLSTFSGTVFSASKKTKYLFYSIAIATIAAVVLNFSLIPMIGIWGAIISILCSHIIACVCRMIFAKKFVNIQNRKNLLFTLLNVVAFCCACYISDGVLKYSLLSALFLLFCFRKWYVPQLVVERLKSRFNANKK